MIEPSFRPRSRSTVAAAEFPAKFRPMLMSAASEPFRRDNWIFEPKLDGMRGLAIVQSDKCNIFSRNGLEFAHKYPSVARDLLSYRRDFVLDGELVCFDENGNPSFERLQERIRMRYELDIKAADVSNPVYYFVFDILALDGKDLTRLKLRERKSLLDATLEETPLVKRTSYFAEDGETLFAACVQNGLEGIVGKNLDSRYECGVRSKNWIKVKILQTADVIIGGHKPDIGFLVGRYLPDGKLGYVGSVMGGLKSADYEYLRGGLMPRDSCPFESSVKRWRATWFEPTVVAEVRFMLWTSGGFLRMPAFTRLRLDVPPHEVKNTIWTGDCNGG